MLASDGRCKTLDAAADGYVRAEGCLALFLSPDGGGCGSVLLGSALNQDGRSSSLTAPHGPSQQAVILKAVRQAEVAPSSVVALHLHGTGTSLGDPVEVGSLAMLLQAPGRGAPLVVTAVKSALGHGESASGLTSLSLLLASHQRRVAVPTLHLRSINPHVRQTLKASKAQASWSCMRATAGAPAAAQGVCATSSFGFSGTNAHMLSRFEAVSAASQPAAVFTRTRCWPLAGSHRLLPEFVVAAAASVQLTARFDTSVEHLLFDSLVAGHYVLSAGLLLELAVAAQTLVLQRGTAASALTAIMLAPARA
jgi:acyl transferase domain-containing protein